ncbi:hypothetical protein EV127DRAFT_404891 [Xylaria flabelliformis]|nr:hypothetical protein EV127DRAFT_404891 [Xylaria flabelliformis]
MENPSDTMGSSPSFEESPPPSVSSEPGPKIREWSQFELDTVCALICKHEHRQISKRRHRCGNMNGERSDQDWALGFATELNEAIHGADQYQRDIPVTDVRELMDFIETKNQKFMAYISRQSTPFRITRSKKYAFQRLCTDFNNAFYKWTIKRRERRRNANIDTEISQLNSLDRRLSSPDRDSYILGTTRIQKILNAELDPNTERGWISNSVYAQRNREGPNIDSTARFARNVDVSQRYILPAKSTHRVRHPLNQRGVIPLPPPPPPSPHPIRHEQVDVQQSNSYDIPRYEGRGADTHSHPTSPVYYGHPNPTFPASPYPPTSPAYFAHTELRQSIHPTGPRPQTPMVMVSPAYQHHSDLRQDVYPMEQQVDASGSLTSPVYDNLSPAFMGYQYPNSAQDNGDFDYSRVLETPASPSSPVYIPNATPAEMMGTQTEGKDPAPTFSELLGQPDFDFTHLDYGEYPPSYELPSAD